MDLVVSAATPFHPHSWPPWAPHCHIWGWPRSSSPKTAFTGSHGRVEGIGTTRGVRGSTHSSCRKLLNVCVPTHGPWHHFSHARHFQLWSLPSGSACTRHFFSLPCQCLNKRHRHLLSSQEGRRVSKSPCRVLVL